MGKTCKKLRSDFTFKKNNSNKRFGQLGQGNTDWLGDGPNEMGDNLSIVDLGFERTAKAIATGVFHTCVLLDNDQVKCFGENG